MPPLFIMTKLTGAKSNEDRPVIFGGFEMQYRHFWIAVIALIPSVIFVAFFWLIMGQFAILWIFVIEGAAFFLIERRKREGLQLRTWQAIRDKSKANVGRLYLCGEPFQAIEESITHFESNTVPLIQYDSQDRLLKELGGYDIDLDDRRHPTPLAPMKVNHE